MQMYEKADNESYWYERAKLLHERIFVPYILQMTKCIIYTWAESDES